MSVTVRPFAARDREAVLALWRDVFHDMPVHRQPDADLERKLAEQPELLLVADEQGSVVGTAMGGYDGHRGWVYYLAVRPDRRRQGVGRKLMESLEAALRARGCPKVNLQIRAGNSEVAAFYRTLGYRVEERVSMGKRL